MLKEKKKPRDYIKYLSLKVEIQIRLISIQFTYSERPLNLTYMKTIVKIIFISALYE